MSIQRAIHCSVHQKVSPLRNIAAYAKATKKSNKQPTGFGKATKPTKKDNSEPDTPLADVAQQTAPSANAQIQNAAPSASTSSAPVQSPNTTSTSSQRLPKFSRDQVISTCAQTSALIAVFGFGIRQLAPLIVNLTHPADVDDMQRLLNWLVLPSLQDMGIAAAVAGGVTVARLGLLAAWPAFREASDASNEQVLSPLQGPVDLAIVSFLPGIAEEILFRGALIPAISPDWRGAAISGLVFGALHVNGGRNAAFAAWASVVGGVYGAALLATGNVYVPIVAHSIANVAASSFFLHSGHRRFL